MTIFEVQGIEQLKQLCQAAVNIPDNDESTRSQLLPPYDLVNYVWQRVACRWATDEISGSRGYPDSGPVMLSHRRYVHNHVSA